MKSVIKPPKTYVDSVSMPDARLQEFWEKKGARDALRIRDKFALPAGMTLLYDQAKMQDHFSLAGWQFGNWTTQEDRFNYVSGVSVGLYHISEVLGVKAKAIGKGKLSIAIGVRGTPKSKATFWPAINQININRWKRKRSVDFFTEIYVKRSIDREYENAISTSGGSGSLAHEYAHFLDRMIAAKETPQEAMFTARPRKSDTGPLVEQLFQALFYDDGKPNQFHEIMHDPDVPKYWRKRAEIFARAFEKCVAMELMKREVKDFFVAKASYLHKFYPSDEACKRAWPLFKRIARVALA